MAYSNTCAFHVTCAKQSFVSLCFNSHLHKASLSMVNYSKDLS